MRWWRGHVMLMLLYYSWEAEKQWDQERPPSELGIWRLQSGILKWSDALFSRLIRTFTFDRKTIMKQHWRCMRILMWIFKIRRVRLRAGFMWSMIRFQVLVNTVMNLRFPQNVGNLISRCAFIFSKGLRSAESEFPNNCMF